MIFDHDIKRSTSDGQTTGKLAAPTGPRCATDEVDSVLDRDVDVWIAHCADALAALAHCRNKQQSDPRGTPMMLYLYACS